jgi:probable rRNA maturation factor
VKISIYNDQKDLKISKKHIKKQVRAIFESEKVSCQEIAINFVDKKTISKLHKKFFNDPSPTDCISFPIDKPFEKDCFLGEIFICPKVASEYLKEDPYGETTLYLIHAILHLLGYDDISKKDKIVMRKKEKSYINFLKERYLGISEKHTKFLMRNGNI